MSQQRKGLKRSLKRDLNVSWKQANQAAKMVMKFKKTNRKQQRKSPLSAAIRIVRKNHGHLKSNLQEVKTLREILK